MGVYIKGMETPKSCWSCDIPLRVLKCPVQTEEEAMRYCSCRHKDCPLVPVPPHGKLIDADAIRADIDEKRPGRSYEDAWTLTVIDAAPTIIPAEQKRKEEDEAK